MSRGFNFWVPMIVFQVAFGLTVFAITREVYINDVPVARTTAKLVSKPWQGMGNVDPNAQIEVLPLVPDQPVSDDPQEIAIQADQYFATKQYQLAAQLYQKLLGMGAGDANIYNSLGLTLQYLGRTDDALQVLNEGISLDPGYQRIWLTLGFVNAQAGNLDQARSALNKAIEMGADNDIGQAAAKMLAQVPGG